jgi:hypothetical protein
MVLVEVLEEPAFHQNRILWNPLSIDLVIQNNRSLAPLKVRTHFKKNCKRSILQPVEPHGQSPWHLTNARVGRHPPLNSGQAGQKLAHSSSRRRGGLSAAGVNRAGLD